MFLKQNKLIFFGLILVTAFLFFYNTKQTSQKQKEIPVKLTIDNFPRFFQLENLSKDETFLKDKTSKKIFFIETKVEDFRTVDPRQACSIESAAIMNPDTEIFFAFVTNTSDINIEFTEIIQILSKYPNINFRYLDPNELSSGTSYEKFFKNDLLHDSIYHIQNRANALRMLLMYIYGGTYLDLDIISMVPIAHLNLTNFLCVAFEGIVNNAIIKFNGSEIGMEILSEYGRKLTRRFQPNVYGANGPNLFSEVLNTFCKNETFVEDAITQCSDFTLLPVGKCYEIRYKEFQKFYEEKFRDETMSRLTKSGSYFVHFWNKMPDFEHKNYTLRGDSKTVYAELAREHCPNVFNSIDKYF